MATVGSYEAKTNLPKLLDRVAKGEEILITKRGKPVALLTAPPASAVDIREVTRKMRELRKGITLGKGITIREMIDEGRR